jgi:hypothetical protein
VREAATTIDKEFHAQSRINTEALSEIIGDPQYAVDDCSRFLRLLGKHVFLAPTAAGTNPAVVYRRITEWPPPVSSFGPGSVAVSCFAPKGFRHFPVDWIEEDVLQVDHRSGGSVLPGSYGDFQRDGAVPRTNGDFTVAAARIAADITLTEMSVDMTWRAHAQDRLDGFVAPAGIAPGGLYRSASHATGRLRIN